MIIIGIDPGTLITGFGIIKVDGNAYQVIDYGCIRPPPNNKLTDRYLIIFNALEEIIEKNKPNAFVVETQYVHKKYSKRHQVRHGARDCYFSCQEKGNSHF